MVKMGDKPKKIVNVLLCSIGVFVSLTLIGMAVHAMGFSPFGVLAAVLVGVLLETVLGFLVLNGHKEVAGIVLFASIGATFFAIVAYFCK